jgi:hypothetical protein
MTVQSLDPEGAVHLADFLVILLAKKDIAGKPSGGTGRLDFTRSIRSHQFSTHLRVILRASVRRHRRAQRGSPMLRSIRPKRAMSKPILEAGPLHHSGTAPDMMRPR